MRYIIYQIKKDKDASYQFMEWSHAKDKMKLDDYERVYYGTTEDAIVQDDIYVLEDLFRIFNQNRPADFTGHSLSVSDIVILYDDDETQCRYYYCDSFGWKDISDDIKERK